MHRYCHFSTALKFKDTETETMEHIMEENLKVESRPLGNAAKTMLHVN